jgi:hypothetical protein
LKNSSVICGEIRYLFDLLSMTIGQVKNCSKLAKVSDKEGLHEPYMQLSNHAKPKD